MEGDAVIEEIVAFWLGDSPSGPEPAEQRREVWYRGGPALDAEIERRFGDLTARACAGEYEPWRASGQGSLALVILLDQFTRNMYRSTARAYAGDARALRIAEDCVDREQDRALSVTGRIFLYHPFHHSESLANQDRGVALVDGIRRDVGPEWHAYLDRRVDGFARHRDIVARFGRFPHRNPTLGRVSTPEEAEYLAGDHETFGQGAAVTARGASDRRTR